MKFLTTINALLILLTSIATHIPTHTQECPFLDPAQTNNSKLNKTDRAIHEQLELVSTSLYAPWRDNYLFGVTKNQAPATSSAMQVNNCAFCSEIAANDDDKYFILRRFDHHVVALSLCPYSKGHLFIIPQEYVQALDELSPQSRSELIEIITASSNILENTFNAHGINIGINLGHIAGINKPDHLYVEILPRWTYDIGYIQLLAKTHVASCDLPHLYKQLKPVFQDLSLS